MVEILVMSNEEMTKKKYKITNEELKKEDELDLKIIAEYEKEKANGKIKTRPIEELFRDVL